MSIRIRVIFVIIFTNLSIVLFSVLAGTWFVRDNIVKSQETELMVVADIADHFISGEIENLRLRAAAVAHSLTDIAETQWPQVLSGRYNAYPQFIGLMVVDSGGEITASAGSMSAPPDIINDIYIQRAFQGRTAFSSTYPTDIGMVSYLAAPLPGDQRILVLTLGGMYFSEQVSTFVIWETGHIFMTDSQGNIIANIRESWVQGRINFIRMAQDNPAFEEVAGVLARIVNQETGTGYFSTDGVPRLCSFRPITASEEGWSMGIIAPLPESPFRDIDRGLVAVAFVACILSAAAAVIASNFIKRPFLQIASLKEAAETNSRYKSTFLANMSHEMRTPLNVIVGLTDLRMEDKKLPTEVYEDLRKINSAGSLLLGIVNDILDISKIEAGKLELMEDDYHTASMLNDIITLNMIRIESKPVKFKVEISDDFPGRLHGDELRIKQIFNNLLSNAFKYTKEGTVTLRVSIERRNKNMILSAVISDTGIGIKPEDIKKLFSDYNQVDTKANRKIEGTGLGLSITRKLVEAMDGVINVESVYGAGSTFSVSLRQGFVNNDILGRSLTENLCNFRYADEKQIASKELTRADLSYARVLVVDDMQNNLDVAAGFMRKYKMQVDCITSGQAAVDLITKGYPVYDAVFMDHMMPEMDGIEATQLIRGLDSEYAQTIPIISLTANALVGNEQMFLDKGFNAFLSKPINIKMLDSILKKWIRKKDRPE